MAPERAAMRAAGGDPRGAALHAGASMIHRLVVRWRRLRGLPGKFPYCQAGGCGVRSRHVRWLETHRVRLCPVCCARAFGPVWRTVTEPLIP